MSLTVAQAIYLKHSGKIIDTKVSIKIWDNKPVICIMKFEFYTFESAIRCLQEISRTIVNDAGIDEQEIV